MSTDFENMDIEAVARAIEEDAGQALPNLRRSLTDVRAGRFGRVHTPAQILAKAARAKTGMTQQAFAEIIHTPLTTLRDWKQGRFEPPGGVTCLFSLLERHPELIRELETAG
ncbi:MAG: XRE family transcriptional regulator [Candidatus Accumulibacter sp.]|jgi:putative transcriptional regulator|nr:XRE family transcriptional regulator [Accumulibacter sp.]